MMDSKLFYNTEDGQKAHQNIKALASSGMEKPFAVDMDNNIKIIDTSGKAINKNDIGVADYKGKY